VNRKDGRLEGWKIGRKKTTERLALVFLEER